MKKIAIDMDGVLANIYSQFHKMHLEEYGETIADEEIDGVEERQAFPGASKYVRNQGFFRTAPVIDDCQRVVEKLTGYYDIFIVSAALEFPNSLNEKLLWLEEHFPFITWKQTVFCGSKDIIRADMMIDDHFRNLDTFMGETYLFTQPHNKLADCGVHKRVSNWLEIEKLLIL